MNDNLIHSAIDYKNSIHTSFPTKNIHIASHTSPSPFQRGNEPEKPPQAAGSGEAGGGKEAQGMTQTPRHTPHATRHTPLHRPNTPPHATPSPQHPATRHTHSFAPTPRLTPHQITLPKVDAGGLFDPAMLEQLENVRRFFLERSCFVVLWVFCGCCLF